MHMHTSDSDEENFKIMDVSGINKLTFRQFKRHMKSCVSDHLSNLEKQEMPNQQCEVSQMLKKHGSMAFFGRVNQLVRGLTAAMIQQKKGKRIGN